jgi:methionyl-tRNA formyltransferase
MKEPKVTKTSMPLRAIVMGTGPFAVPSFRAILAAGHNITLVVTRPQPAVKTRGAAPPAPVRAWAESESLPIFDPPSINDADAIERLVAEQADLLVVCDYGQILKPAALESAPLGGINLHGSLLPAYRGAAPVQWAVLCGDAVAGISVIHMTPRLDGGPILQTRETPVGEKETSGELEERLSQLGVPATLEAMEMLSVWDRKSPIGVAQDASKVSKAPRLQKADGEIKWSRSSREIDWQVRGMQPWPIAFTHITVAEGKPPLRVAVKQVSVSAETRPGSAVAGQILPGEGLLVCTGDGVVSIDRLQPAGKREMTGKEFLCGYKNLAGIIVH